MTSQKPFLNFVIDRELLNKIDDFQFENRFKSRAAAIKWLLDWALKQNPIQAHRRHNKSLNRYDWGFTD